jgi:addiction module HigA family antidote
VALSENSEIIRRKSRREYLREFPPETRTIPLTHPGVMLKEEFLDPMGISQTELAHAIGASVNRINEICRGKRGISPETAYLLAEYFDMAVEFWAGLQHSYDLDVVEQTIGAKLQRVQPRRRQPTEQSA